MEAGFQVIIHELNEILPNIYTKESSDEREIRNIKMCKQNSDSNPINDDINIANVDFAIKH